MYTLISKIKNLFRGKSMEAPNQLLRIRNDSAGSGEFGASRDGGNRRHLGIDYETNPGGEVLSPVTGTITKLGYPYANDLSWRYVQITDKNGSNHRFFYVDPEKRKVGDRIREYDALGVAQDVSSRYPDRGMTPHVHYEIKTKDGEYVAPDLNS